MRCYCCNALDAKRQPKDDRYYCSSCSSSIKETLADFEIDSQADLFYYRTNKPNKKVSVKNERSTDSNTP